MPRTILTGCPQFRRPDGSILVILFQSGLFVPALDLGLGFEVKMYDFSHASPNEALRSFQKGNPDVLQPLNGAATNLYQVEQVGSGTSLGNPEKWHRFTADPDDSIAIIPDAPAPAAPPSDPAVLRDRQPTFPDEIASIRGNTVKLDTELANLREQVQSLIRQIDGLIANLPR